MQNQSCFSGRLIVAPLVHLLLIASRPMQRKLINNPLCYLTDHKMIREVQLHLCHTLIKKLPSILLSSVLYTYLHIYAKHTLTFLFSKYPPACMQGENIVR